MWRRAPEDEVTTLSRNLARQSPSDAAPHHSRMETSPTAMLRKPKISQPIKGFTPTHFLLHVYYYALRSGHTERGLPQRTAVSVRCGMLHSKQTLLTIIF